MLFAVSVGAMATRAIFLRGRNKLLNVGSGYQLASVKCFSDDSWVPVEKKTHTGQVFHNVFDGGSGEVVYQAWKENDYRLVRFIDRPKHVNPNFAIDLIAATPPAPRKERVVWCDGGGGPIGHPKVYINLDKPGNHTCGYCGLRFYKEDSH